jgi:hypothetical protein
MTQSIEIIGDVRNGRVMITTEVFDGHRPGRVIQFFADPRVPKGRNATDLFTVQWADGTESEHRRSEFSTHDVASDTSEEQK